MSTATSSSTRLNGVQRYTSDRPCPICGGSADDRRGQGVRCTGFLSDDGRYARCSREDKAGGLTLDGSTTPASYVHFLGDPCRCTGELHPGAVFVQASQPKAKAKVHKPTVKGKFVEEYLYREPDGRPRFKVTRLDTKEFPQHHANGTDTRGRTNWVCGMVKADGSKVERLPYSLPGILDSQESDATVYLVEGEKDANRLISLGLVGTTLPEGAKEGKPNPYIPVLVPHLEGRNVVVLVDNDAVGHAHANAEATALLGVARRVVVVDLTSIPGAPEIPPKGDVSDFLDLGGNLADLIAFATAQPEWKPKSKPDDPTEDEGDYRNDIIDHRPKIDPAAFHGIAGEIVRMADPHTEADPVAVLVQFLIGFANALGRGPYWIASATHHYMVLFVVLVGSTASGRKGTAWDVASFFLAHLDPTWARERVTQGLSTGEGLIHHVRDPVYVTEDGEQKCVDPGVDDKRLLAVETELGRVLKAMGRQGNTLSGVVRQVWDCRETLSTLTKNNPTRATGAHVGIVGHVTSDELKLLLNDAETANGFGNRFLWICSRRSKSLPDGGAFFSVEWGPILARLRAIHEKARHVRFMRRDDEAREIWHSVYPDLTAGQPGLLGMMLARAEPMVMRLACLYALLDGESIVRAEHMEAALALWQYAEASARFIFGESLGDEKAERLLEALRESPEGLKRSQLVADVFAGHIQKADLDRALGKLVDLGLIHCRPGIVTSGRPPQLWFAGRLPSDAK